MKKSILIYLGLIFLIPFQVIAQNNLENNIKVMLSDPLKGASYLKGYVQPLSTAFGISMGGSLFHRAYVKTFPRYTGKRSSPQYHYLLSSETLNCTSNRYARTYNDNENSQSDKLSTQ